MNAIDRGDAYVTERAVEMRWVASIMWALIASLITNGLLAFVMGGLDHAWVIVAVNLMWLAIFLRACPTIYDISSRPTPPG